MVPLRRALTRRTTEKNLLTYLKPLLSPKGDFVCSKTSIDNIGQKKHEMTDQWGYPMGDAMQIKKSAE